MNKYTLTGILGWFFDAFIIECLIAPFRSRLSLNTDPISLFALIALLGLFIASVWYHVKGRSGTTWISPGEYLIGTRLTNNRKARINPWLVSRLVLFIVIVYNLLQTARTYDAGEVAFFGYSAMGMVILGSFLFNAMILSGSALLANARYAGMALVSLAFIYLTASRYVNYLQLKQTLQLEYAKYALVGLVLNIIVGAVYFYLRAKRQGTPSAA